MISTLRLGVAFAILLASFAPGVADARRPATTAEKRAIVSYGPPRCATVFVSTIDSRFASGQWNAKGRGCLRYAGNGIDIVGRADGRWKSLGGMSDCTPIEMAGVPDRVYFELTRAYCGWCPSGREGVRNLKGNGLSCLTARVVSGRWMDTVRCPVKGSCTFRVSRAVWTCKASRHGHRSDVSCTRDAQQSRNVYFVFPEHPYLSDGEAKELIHIKLMNDDAEDVEWGNDPCERSSDSVVVCAYRYQDSDGRWWEGRTRVRRLLDDFDIEVLSAEPSA